MRVVLDTNVIISGLLRRGSPADLLRQAWDERRFTLVTSEWQLDEIRRVSRYPKLRKRLLPQEVGQLMGQIRRRADVIGSLPEVASSSDPDDDPLLATAVEGKADWLVTGDKADLLSLGKVKGIRIVTARYLVGAIL